ncbi:MAG: excinuclease ABC subunit UvrC [Gemmatimonadales bacterium]|nr:MAG: excinuclease ABC subunit UvrC [Gemmatimonadales bacterium]
MIEARRLDHLPTRPGVYLLKDGEGSVLYIGKARSLRSRVRSYFRGEDRSRGIRIRELARRAVEVETIPVGSEAEALILESNLIKEHQPPFNIQLRDDKRYPYIKVTVQEPFPRVFVTRRLRGDGARYFGPFTSVGPLRQALEVVKRLYTVRSCRYDLPREAPPRPCLDYHIGRCQAPCVGFQTREDYREMVDEILRILGGDTQGLEREVAGKMEEAARELRFEEAARHRDVLEGLASIAREQRVERFEGGDQDVLGVARDGELGAAVVLRIRKGTLLGRETHRFSGIGEEGEADLLGRFAALYYLGRGEAGDQDLPAELLLPQDFADREVLEEVLSERRGRRVHLRVPERGAKHRLVELAATNARHLLEDRVTELERAPDRAEAVLYELQDRLHLKVVPRFIVCFDISHFQGTEVVASAVAFENGEPRKSLYRHMRIRGDWGNDDFRSMAEAVERYLSRRLEGQEPLPELLVVDGGRGQLSAVLPVLKRLGAEEVAVAALAKREEEVFLPGRRDPVRIPRREPALRLLQRLRNEAHRFAVSYNRKLRTRRTIQSRLGEIPGIGPGRQQALLTRFGSVEGIVAAGVEEVIRVPGFSRVLAERVLSYLQGEGETPEGPPAPSSPIIPPNPEAP